MYNDPTYNKKDIDSRPDWKLAFWMSEIMNDTAPLDWGKYIPLARALLKKYRLKEIYD